MTDHLIDERGTVIVKVGDEVENDDARFFVGSINESQQLCAIDKARSFSLKNPASPLAACIRQGNYSASAVTLRQVDEDPTPYCSYGHRTKASCDCGPIAANE